MRKAVKLLGTLAAIVIFVGGLYFARSRFGSELQDVTNTIFTFSAAGDYAANLETDRVLEAIKVKNPDFHIALGDFSYNTLKPESKWCEYVRGHIGQSIPFELISGNHESNGKDGLITNFVKCLPSKIENLTGTYGKEYYFDYPREKPLARIILISPNLDFVDQAAYNYTARTPQLDWLLNAITSARSKNIPWVIVGMHKDCISPSRRTCEITPQVMNVLINNKVDVILQAHSHIYARSKPLLCVSADTRGVIFEQACTTENNLHNIYNKGEGSLLLISGTGGQTLTDITPTSEAVNYFEKYAGKNYNPTFGFVYFKVNEQEIRGEFVSVNNALTDSFVVKTSR